MKGVAASTPLFDTIVAESQMGLVAPFAIARALRKVGVFRPEAELTVELLRAGLPHIREVLRLYCDAATAERAYARIERVASAGS